jgi:low affinity Fe/Cu permease
VDPVGHPTPSAPDVAERPGDIPPPIDLGPRRDVIENSHRGRFDDIAEAASNLTGKGPFFALCLLITLIWLLSITLLSFEIWNLIASTATGVVTFLLVALLQNSQRRAEAAMNEKLNALAAAVADLMRFHSGEDRDLRDNIALLQATVGLEERISANGERITEPIDSAARAAGGSNSNSDGHDHDTTTTIGTGTGDSCSIGDEVRAQQRTRH